LGDFPLADHRKPILCSEEKKEGIEYDNLGNTDVRPGLVDTAMAKGEGLFWVMPVEKVARQICKAIHRKKSKVYVTKRWHILAIVNKILPFFLYKRM